MEVEEIREEARQYFGDIAPSHDWHHVQRVEKLAEKILEDEEADREVVKLAVLLHDIGRGKEDRDEIDDHAEWGAKEAEKLLKRHGIDEETVEKVRHCIESHRYSNPQEPETVEAEILSDADNLDALGAIGIARVFTVTGERGRKMVDPDLPPEEDDSEHGKTALNHVYKKGLNLKERMYTDKGQKIAEQRHEYVENYVERLEEEVRGNK